MANIQVHIAESRVAYKTNWSLRYLAAVQTVYCVDLDLMAKQQPHLAAWWQPQPERVSFWQLCQWLTIVWEGEGEGLTVWGPDWRWWRKSVHGPCTHFQAAATEASPGQPDGRGRRALQPHDQLEPEMQFGKLRKLDFGKLRTAHTLKSNNNILPIKVDCVKHSW